jgi:2-C-methyl-D-erythritol 4-phosphate cytidylyltransferase
MIVAIVPSAGKGERFGAETPKQFLKLKGIPILIHTLLKFEKNSLVDEIVVVAPSSYIDFTLNLIKDYGLKKINKVVEGGKTRQESVWKGINAFSENAEIFLIHDAVRPFFSESLINSLVNTLLPQIKKKTPEFQGVIPAVPVRDTLNLVENQVVKKNIPRENLYHIQTPQAIKADILKLCLQKACKENLFFPDESSLLLYYGYKVKVVKGSFFNLKITYPEDFQLAEKLIDCKIENLLEAV